MHTDLSEENLLVHPDGRLSGVIDFGDIGLGDRSVDLSFDVGRRDPYAPPRRDGERRGVTTVVLRSQPTAR